MLVDNDKNVKVVARGYDKFFNAEEREGSGNPEMTPFEEKLAKFPKNEDTVEEKKVVDYYIRKTLLMQILL